MNKSKKFKSIGFSVVYKMKYDYKNISAFNILAKYLGNCNANYPSIELFNKYIESLYGASVGIKPNYVGSLFTVTFYINFLNPKYVNDDRDKILVIIDELTSSYIYEDNLMSFLNNKVKLLEHSIENDVFFLNFNEYLFDSNDIVLEEVLYCISYSVFDNYDVSMVMFQVNGKEVNHVFRTDIY